MLLVGSMIALKPLSLVMFFPWPSFVFRGDILLLFENTEIFYAIEEAIKRSHTCNFISLIRNRFPFFHPHDFIFPLRPHEFFLDKA